MRRPARTEDHITANSGLSDDEIGNMVNEGEKHEEEDKRRREEVELRNRADQLCYSVEKALEDAKDKLPEDKVKDVKDQVTELRGAIAKQDQDAIKSGTEKLEKLMADVASAAYQAADGAEATGDDPQPPPDAASDDEKKKKEDVIDAEFEESN